MEGGTGVGGTATAGKAEQLSRGRYRLAWPLTSYGV
jgi:hypothetical protein